MHFYFSTDAKKLHRLFVWQETQRLKAEPVPGIEATPDESNARYFHVVVVGPRDVRCMSCLMCLVEYISNFVMCTNI